MASVPDFERKVRAFADQMQELLNQTVCDYARVGVSIDERGPAAVVGTGITGGNVKSEPMPLCTLADTPLSLDVSSRLTLDGDEGQFLSVQSSYFGISVGDSDDREEVIHYDFEREKDLYTEAHIQVHARHAKFEAYTEELSVKNRLGRYHLPVGGRRLRPCLEDVIELLITENLVEPHDGWKRVLDEQRKQYRKIQIAAIVRKHHGTAIEELQRHGYVVINPKNPSKRAKIIRLIYGTTAEAAKGKPKKQRKK